MSPNPALFADGVALYSTDIRRVTVRQTVMSKTLTEAQVTTANARSRLGPGVHWRRLDAEAHLGYRKGKQGGVWFVRWRNHHEGGNYKQVPVGVANDINDKPAAGILTFEQAVRNGTGGRSSSPYRGRVAGGRPGSYRAIGR
jgi:hypothetical protein